MPEIVVKENKYDWKITLKKMLISALQAGGVAVLPIVIDYLRGLETVVPVQYMIWVGLGVSLLTGLLNWLKHRKN